MSSKIFNYENFDEYTVNNYMMGSDGHYVKTHFRRQIMAAGCLFYKIVEGEVYLLVISYTDYNRDIFDDLGGKFDIYDETVTDGMFREVLEETNFKIGMGVLDDLICENNDNGYYSDIAKYYCIMIKVDDTFFKDTTVFGDCEKAENIRRTINWHKYKDIKDKLAVRIKTCFSMIRKLEKEGREALEKMII